MWFHIRSTVIVAWLALGPRLWAGGDAAVLNYQGRVWVEGQAFNGEGHFSFAILEGSGEVLWASGPFPFQDSTQMPAGVISLSVSNGLYSIGLGETNAGMPPLQGTVLSHAAAPKLRVWFNDGTHGWRPAGADVSLASMLAAGAESQTPAMNGASAEAILRELRQVRSLLERQRANLPAAPPRPAEPTIVTVPLGDGPSLGRADAPLVLVEFTDYQCPFCKRFQQTALSELTRNYVQSGQLRIISRNLALPFHGQAEAAALAALCAHQQQKFWPMREMLFTNLPSLTLTNFVLAAADLKMDLAAFGNCLEAKTFATQLKRDGLDAQAAGITGTPSFVLGKPMNDKVTGVLIVGAQPYAAFDAELKKLLADSR